MKILSEKNVHPNIYRNTIHTFNTNYGKIRSQWSRSKQMSLYRNNSATIGMWIRYRQPIVAKPDLHGVQSACGSVYCRPIGRSKAVFNTAFVAKDDVRRYGLLVDTHKLASERWVRCRLTTIPQTVVAC